MRPPRCSAVLAGGGYSTTGEAAHLHLPRLQAVSTPANGKLQHLKLTVVFGHQAHCSTDHSSTFLLRFVLASVSNFVWNIV